MDPFKINFPPGIFFSIDEINIIVSWSTSKCGEQIKISKKKG
jgi:hypothetical protein